MDSNARQDEMQQFDSLPEAFEAAAAQAEHNPIVLLTNLWGAYQVFGEEALADIDSWAFPAGNTERSVAPLARDAAHALAEEVAADSGLGVVVRVPDGYRVYEDMEGMSSTIVDAVLPRDRCSFCEGEATTEEPGFIGPRFSACASCGRTCRKNERVFGRMMEPEPSCDDPARLLEATVCSFDAAEIVATTLAALMGEDAWALPVGEIGEAYRFATESALRGSILDVRGTAVLGELLAPRDEVMDEQIQEIATRAGTRVGVVTVGPLIVVHDDVYGYIPHPFRQLSVLPHVTCRECGAEGLDPLTGEAYHVLEAFYCTACKERLYETDPDFEWAWDNEW